MSGYLPDSRIIMERREKKKKETPIMLNVDPKLHHIKSKRKGLYSQVVLTLVDIAGCIYVRMTLDLLLLLNYTRVLLRLYFFKVKVIRNVLSWWRIEETKSYILVFPPYKLELPLLKSISIYIDLLFMFYDYLIFEHVLHIKK